jgi:uncharacterized GH25 family protein
MGRNQSVISGTVRDREGKPVGGARVYFTSGPVALPDIAALTDDKGSFSLSAPSAGTYEIETAADGFSSASVTVQVNGDQAKHLEITLKD